MNVFIIVMFIVSNVKCILNVQENEDTFSFDNASLKESKIFNEKLGEFISKKIYFVQNFTRKDSLFNSSLTISLLNNSLIANASQYGPVYGFGENQNASQASTQSNDNIDEEYKISQLKIRQTNSNDLFETVSENTNDIGTTEYMTESESETTTEMSNVTELSDSGFENSTELINVTTTTNASVSTSTVAPTTVKPMSWRRTKSKPSRGGVCHCDLTKNSCDVNCCCDSNCSESDKSVFSLCLDDFKESGHWSHCGANDLDYKNSPWLLEKQSSSLFCVYKENMPPKLKNKKTQLITTNEELQYVAKQYFSWPDRQHLRKISFDNSKPYSYNDNIWIFFNSTLTILDVPSAHLNIMCMDRINLRYLVDQKTRCYSTLENSDTFNVYLKHRHIYLISSPVDVNDTWIGNIQECPKNICIPMIPHVCTLKSCSLLNITKEKFVPSCENNFCRNMVTSVRYHLYSNGSSGYTNASVFFGLSDIRVTSDVIEQSFEVINYWISKNESDTIIALSGNPGYLPGKPVIVSHIITHNEANNSESTNMFDYFKYNNSYPLRNVVSFPKNVNGFCILSNVTFNDIKFGENMEFKCKIALNVSMFVSQSNGSNACMMLQDKIMSHSAYDLAENNSVAYVSLTGNPKPDAKNWIGMIRDTQMNKVEGTFDELNKTLFCKYLIRKLKYEFAYVTNDQSKRVRQMNIVGSRLQFSVDDETTFYMTGNEISTTMVVSSMFYDVTTPEVVEYAKGPSFQINLPGNFFHPFTLSNDSSDIFVNFTLILIAVSTVLLQK